MKKHQTNLNWKTYYIITDFYSWENIKVKKNKERPMNCSKLRSLNRKLNSTCDSRFDGGHGVKARRRKEGRKEI